MFALVITCNDIMGSFGIINNPSIVVINDSIASAGRAVFKHNWPWRKREN